MALSDEERTRRGHLVRHDWGGIYPVYEAFYIHSILYAAGRAQTSFKGFDNAVAKNANAATVVATVHEALTHSAGLSRFFWPPCHRRLHQARAKKLRDAFGVNESSPLFNRDLRNALEHFDERLDEFLLEDLAGYFFPAPMVASASLADERLGKIFRLVDPSDEVFILLGQKYSFRDLRVAIDDIIRRTNDMTMNGDRLT